VKIDFYEAETYGTEIKQSRQEKRTVKIKRRPEYDPDIDVLLIDDIADTLQTLSAIKKDCITTLGVKPEKLKICFLLDKILKNPSEQVKELRHELKPDYVGFEVPDVWVAGYGIDAGEDFRLLTSIITVKETYYINKR
jgi:hypoxanthine phosphoribosyltransferase